MTVPPPPPPDPASKPEFSVPLWLLVVLTLAVIGLTVTVVVLASDDGGVEGAIATTMTTTQAEGTSTSADPPAVTASASSPDTTEAPPPTTVEPPTEVTRFVQSGLCVGEELPRLVPASARQDSTVSGDFDGDGIGDRLLVYRDPEINHWMVRSEFGNGYEGEVVVNNHSGDNVGALFSTRLGPKDVAVLRLGRSDYFGLFVSAGPCTPVHQSPDNVEVTMGDLDGFKCEAAGISHTMVKPAENPTFDFTYSAVTYTWNDLLTSLEVGPEVFAAMCCRSPEHDDLIYSSGGFDC